MQKCMLKNSILANLPHKPSHTKDVDRISENGCGDLQSRSIMRSVQVIYLTLKGLETYLSLDISMKSCECSRHILIRKSRRPILKLCEEGKENRLIRS